MTDGGREDTECGEEVGYLGAERVGGSGEGVGDVGY